MRSMTPSEKIQFELFKKELRGIPGYKVATAMNFLNHGVDFRGCSKEMLAESWALKNHALLGHKSIQHITLDMIKAKVEETYPGGKSHMGPAPDPVKVEPKKILTSRELFELWIKKVQVYADLTLDPQDMKTYKSLDTDWLWRAWQAGRQS